MFAGDMFSAVLKVRNINSFISIILTVVITVILLKVDVGKLAEKYLKKKRAQKDRSNQEKPNIASRNAIKKVKDAHKTTQIPPKSQRSKANRRGSLKKTATRPRHLFGAKANVEVVESDVGEIYLIEGKPILFKVRRQDFAHTALLRVHLLKPQKSWLTWALFHMFARAQP